MSDRNRNRPPKQLNISEMRQLRELTRDADGDMFSLEEILAEFHTPPGGTGLPLTPQREEEGWQAPQLPPTAPPPVPKAAAPNRAAPGTEDPEQEYTGRRILREIPPESASPAETPPPRRAAGKSPSQGGEGRGKVVAFPGTQPLPRLELDEDGYARPAGGTKPRFNTGPIPYVPGSRKYPAPPPEPEDDDEDVIEEPEDEDPPSPDWREDTIVPFPKRQNPIAAFLGRLNEKVNDYADQMFVEDENTDQEEVRLLEELIPGTDEEELEEPEEDEEEEDTSKRPSRLREGLPRFRRPAPRPDPPPPDTAPKILARACSRGLSFLRLRCVLVFLLAAAALGQLLLPSLGLAWPAPLDQPRLQQWLAVILLAAGTLLSFDVLITGLIRAARLRLGMDLLAVLACLFTLADGVALALLPEGPGRLPYSAVVLAGLWLMLHGEYHKKCAIRLSCRTASASSSPYRVTLDEGKWNGRDTYTKWTGTDEGFGSRMQMDDGAQLLYRRICPLLLAACIVLPPLAVWTHPGDLLWGLSALFSVSAAFGSSLAYGRSYHKVARRLISSGAALAGWPGVSVSRQAERILITDNDLFPPGYVSLNGYKVMGDFPRERVVAYTATVLRDAGSPLTKLFHDQLRALGGLMRNTAQLTCYEGGGFSANIRGDRVLVGSAAFMNLMEITMPAGLNVKSAVFCAVNGELAGIFALSYNLPDTVFPSLEELMRERVGPVLATRDFNLIPAMLQQRFRLAADKMDFPPVERRRELSSPEQDHGEALTALLCREGLFPLAEAVTSARRLRRATLLGAALCCVGAAIGVVLAAYLVSASAYGSLSPLNLLVYMTAWCLPVWLLSSWVHRF